MAIASTRHVFPVRHYDLAATLDSGQAFRWEPQAGAWLGVVGQRWVKLRQTDSGIEAQTGQAVADWRWLADYLQVEADLAAMLASFPDDPPMRAAVKSCHGLRLLRQEPWECLASFILSSTKQIVQIRQIIGELCRRYGEPLAVPSGAAAEFAFPTAARLAEVSEAELRESRMGFRAPFLREAARRVAAGEMKLDALGELSLAAARVQLEQLPGVGPKIADCVLLFSGSQPAAFPVDVWVMKALRQLYFPEQEIALPRLKEFAATHFGPHAGCAQQYLFHYMRKTAGRVAEVST
jgi:N-glycosylase/DNA lyase